MSFSTFCLSSLGYLVFLISYIVCAFCECIWLALPGVSGKLLTDVLDFRRFVYIPFFSFSLASCLGLILQNRSFSSIVVFVRLCLPRQILVWCDVMSLMSAPLVGPRLFV